MRWFHVLCAGFCLSGLPGVLRAAESPELHTIGSALGRVVITIDQTAALVRDGRGATKAIALATHPAPTWRARLAAAKLAHPGATVEATAWLGQRQIAITHVVAVMPLQRHVVAALTQRHACRVVSAQPDGTWMVEPLDDDPLAGCRLADVLAADPDVRWAEAQVRWPARVKATPNDPLYSAQWALNNDGSVSDTTAGVDIRAPLAWDSARGVGINVAIVDSGIEYTHPDLSPTLIAELALDLFETDGGPAGPLPSGAGEEHGTVTAGIAIARGFNGVGICGTAPSSGLAPIRLIAGSFTDTMAANALRVGVTPPTTSGSIVDVSNNSWGEIDDGVAFKPATNTQATALSYGTSTGRGGRGIIYVFSAGNGGIDDDTAFDGYQQYRQAIVVGSLDGHGDNASYTEPGANLLVSAPGGDAAGAVSTDQVGAGGYVVGDYLAPSNAVTGTSFSAPLVSGTAALLLEANPRLTWRDVQHVLVNTARPMGVGFQLNAAGLLHSHRQGFGLIDAAAAVLAATSWAPVPAESNVVISGSGTGAIPDLSTLNVTFDASAAGDLRVEAAQLTVTVTHAFWADLEFTLTSPSGTSARVEARLFDSTSATRTFTVICRPFWNETATGIWTLAITDTANADVGTCTAASLSIYGWQPRAIPSASLASPTTVRAGDASATITLTGTGFAADAAGLTPVTTATWTRGVSFGTATVTAVSSSSSLNVVLPTAALAGTIGDPVDITLSNSAFAGIGGGTGGAVTITLRANAAPTLAASSVSAVVSSSASTPLNTSDADNDTLTYTSTAATLGTVTFSGANLVFTAGASLGSESVTVTADDGNGGTVNALFTLTVTAAPPSGGSGGGGGGSGGGCGAAGLSGVISLLLAMGLCLTPRVLCRRSLALRWRQRGGGARRCESTFQNREPE